MANIIQKSLSLSGSAAIPSVINGAGILNIEQTAASEEDGGKNIFTVTLTDGSKATFTVKNGSKGSAGDPGSDGQDGIGIKSVEQTSASTEDGGTNIITVTKSDGTSFTFQVKNGSKGSAGPAGADGQPGADGKSAYQYAKDGGYAGTEAEFAEKLAQEQLTGTTNELTPTQVYDAVSAGIPVKVQYTDSTFGLLFFTAFNVSESMNVIVANTIAYYEGFYFLGALYGDKTNNMWNFMITALAQEKDIPVRLPNPNYLAFTGAVADVYYDGSDQVSVEIPVTLPNPNCLTFTGAVTDTYDGSNPVSVEIPSAVTDDHINELIDTKLGVIENGSY